MPNDDDDLGSVLLGSSDPSSDMDYDPFSVVGGENDNEARGDISGYGQGPESDHPIGERRYSGASGEGSEGIPADDSRPLLRPGGSDQLNADAQWTADRERAAGRDRQLRRVAEQRSGGAGTGEDGGARAPAVANTIRDAAARIRADFAREPGTAERVGIGRQLEGQAEHGTQQVQPRKKITYERSSVLTPPQFRHTEFEAIVSKLQSNTDGSWMLTLRIPPYCRQQATLLGDAYGLALGVTVERLSFLRDGT